MKRRSALCGAVAFISFLCAVRSFAQGGNLGSWAAKPSLPSPRANGAVGLIGRNIYYAAGYNSGNPTKTLFIYNLDTKTWKTGANLPVALHHIGNAPVVNGKLYVMGGDTHGDSNSPKPGGAEHTGTSWALEYDPAADQWKKLKSMIQTTATCAITAFKDKIYVMGGVDSFGIVMAVNQVYDPAADAWKLLKPMPTRRDHPGAEVHDSLIYVCSGGVRKVNVGAFEAYSPASDTWYTLPDIPTPRSDIGFGFGNGRFYAFGGEWPGIWDTNEEYDPVAKKWRTVLKMTEVWKALACATVGDTIYSFGGYLASGMTARGVAFIPPANSTALLLPQGNLRKTGTGVRFEGFNIRFGNGQDALGRGTKLSIIPLPSREAGALAPIE
jgi:hypothetical protein